MTISTHVLDTSTGHPAAAIAVQLYRQEGGRWVEVSRGATSEDGRVSALLPPSAAGGTGSYRLAFDVASYFRRRAVETFYDTVVVDFVIRDADAHYHVPLLVSPYGYSTYRGS